MDETPDTSNAPHPDSLLRARVFQAEALEHCVQQRLTAVNLLADPETLLGPVAERHGLLVKRIADGDYLFGAAVLVIADAMTWGGNIVGLLCVVHYDNDEMADQLLLYPADSLVGAVA